MADHEDKSHGAEAAHGGGGSHGGGVHGGGSHGGGAHEEHEGAPEWLISFADNVALMMGFFVILLAMNMKEPTSGGIGGKEKFPNATPPDMLDAVLAIREAFHNPPRIDSADPKEQALVRRLKEREKPGESKQSGPEGTRQNVQSQRPSDYEAPCAVIAFEDGSAELTAKAREDLADVAPKLAGQRFIVDVRGNVSASEAHASPDRGMFLSYQRAVAVARELEANGLKWRQLRVVAGGDSYRLTTRASDKAGHRTNQRTELYQTPDQMPEDPYAMEDGE